MMQLVKPKNPDDFPAFENPREIQLGQEPITFKAGMLISVSDNPEEVGISQNTQQLNSLDD